MVVAGARPNFMKVAPIVRALRDARIETTLVHTEQHYDANMSGSFFSDLDIPKPDFSLGVGSGSHAVQTAKVMEAFEAVLLEVRPTWVVVVGDVNSTLACALVVAKLKEALDVKLAHVEAGLRSRDWRMPEEINRVLTDRLADLLLTPSRDAFPNLVAEGIDPERIVFVGNVMIDTLFHQLPIAVTRDIAGQLDVSPGAYALATLHRPSNVDDETRFRTILSALSEIGRRLPVVFPIHPRTRQNLVRFGLSETIDGVRLCNPLGYTDMLSLQNGAAVAITDSGGVQEETTVLGVPCVTVREQTERPVTVTDGTNRLVPWPPTVQTLIDAVDTALAAGRLGVGERSPEGWDGSAANRIAEALAGERAGIHTSLA
jgi:UDP-N-acetylglucosamine 2-epimerase (non-hydrolysing)